MRRKIWLSAAFIVGFILFAISSNAISPPPFVAWEERVLPNQFTDVSFNGIAYTSLHASDNPHVIPPKVDRSEIGEFLYTTTITGVDERAGVIHTITGAVYSLHSVSAEYAIAVKYEEYDGYYKFVNLSYTPETLGDVIRDLGVQEEHMTNIVTDFSSQPAIQYTMVDGSALWNLLRLNTSAERRDDRGGYVVGGMQTRIYNEAFHAHLFLNITGGTLTIDFPFRNRVHFSVDGDAIHAFRAYVQEYGTAVVQVREHETVEFETDTLESPYSRAGTIWGIAIATALIVILAIVLKRKLR